MAVRTRLIAFTTLLLAAGTLHAQDQQHRGRKYKPPPPTSRVTVTVLKATNGKPIENAAVIFHPMKDSKDEGNLELKTNEEGRAVIDVIPTGDDLRLQVIATGFQTFGDDYQVDGDSKDIIVKMKRPSEQYSIYGKDGAQKTTDPNKPQTNQGSAQKPQ